MASKRAPVTPALRVLREAGVSFTEHLFDYHRHPGAEEAAEAIRVDPFATAKTIVFTTDTGAGVVALMHGNLEVSTKKLAREMGVRSVRPATQREADRFTGYQFGGTSPLGMRSDLPVFAQRTLADLETVYVNGGSRGFLIGIDPATYRVTNWLVGVGVGGGNTGSTHPSGVLSTLQAWDPVRQTLAWEVPLPGVYNPGTMTTAGNLVFQGRVDGLLVAYRADTGEELWRYDLGLGILAPPITYAVDGRQYVALLVGYGSLMARGPEAAALGWAYGVHMRRLVAFSLDGTATLPPQPPPQVVQPLDVPFEIDRSLIARGAVVYGQQCSLCHGQGVVAGGLTPDLRASPQLKPLRAPPHASFWSMSMPCSAAAPSTTRPKSAAIPHTSG